MKINDYNNVLNRIHPEDSLKNQIIEKCIYAEKKTYKKRKFVPVIAIATAVCIGTLGVSAAVNFDWIKSFFNEDFVVSDDVTTLVAQTSNYECYSNCGIKMSLDGVIADEQSVYCQFSIDEAPVGYNLDSLSVANLAFKNFSFEEYDSISSTTDFHLDTEKGKFIFSCTYDKNALKNNDSIAIHVENHDKLPKNGEVKTIYDTFDKIPCDCYNDMTKENFIEKCHNDYILIKFDMAFNNDKIPCITITENEINHNGWFGSLINNIKITPFMISCNVSASGYISVDGKIILENGEEIKMTSGIYSKNEIYKEDGTICEEKIQQWDFEKPINPEDVAEIYIRNACVYTK